MKVEQVRSARLSQKLSQAELAERSGISLRQIKAIEKGEVSSPQPFTMRALSLVLERPNRESIELMEIKDLEVLASHASTSENDANNIYSEIMRERFRREVLDLMPSAHYLELGTEPGKYGIHRVINSILDSKGQEIDSELIYDRWYADYQNDFEYILKGDVAPLWYDIHRKSFIYEIEFGFNSPMEK